MQEDYDYLYAYTCHDRFGGCDLYQMTGVVLWDPFPIYSQEVMMLFISDSSVGHPGFAFDYEVGARSAWPLRSLSAFLGAPYLSLPTPPPPPHPLSTGVGRDRC